MQTVSQTGRSTGIDAGIETAQRAGFEPVGPAKRPRDHRIDLIRGVALASIFINHIPGNCLGGWTTRNFGFSDAAEVFVLLAGFAAALAYYPCYAHRDNGKAVRKAFARAGLLYGAHLVTTLAAFFMLWCYWSAAGEAPDHDLLAIAPLVADPTLSITALLSGGLQLSYFNILPLYVVLLATLPAVLWIAARDLRLAAAVSAGLYLAANAGGLALPKFGYFDSWFFNPLAWQLLFVGGVLAGIIHRSGRQVVGYHPALFAVALAYLAFSGVWVAGGFGAAIGVGLVPEWAGSLLKPDLPPLRVLHVCALAYVVCHSPVWTWLARVPKNFALTRMGRHSLPVFAAGSLLSMAGWIVTVETGGGVAIDLAIVAAGLSMLALIAYWLEHDLPLLSLRRTAFGLSTP